MYSGFKKSSSALGGGNLENCDAKQGQRSELSFNLKFCIGSPVCSWHGCATQSGS